jgi:hypothetical protein
MGTGKGIGTLDGSWMRDHMYRLSQLVLFLKQNVKVRRFLPKNEGKKREGEMCSATKKMKRLGEGEMFSATKRIETCYSFRVGST